MHRSFRRRVRRVLKRKSLKLLAWCKLVLVNIAFGFMTQVVACRACLLKLWSCKEAGPSLKLPKPEQCPRPCLPSSLSLDLNALPEKHVLLRVTHALCAWAAQVHMSTHDWNNLSHQFLQSALLPADVLDTCAFRCCVACVCACKEPSLAKLLSHQLGLVMRAMVDWMLPSGVKTKKHTSLEFDHLLHVVGSIRMFLHTRWQARSGRRRQAWAKQRLQCVHPDLAAALFQPGPMSKAGVSSCVAFLSLQLACKTRLPSGHGCLYVLGSMRECYLGSTACDRGTWRCSMSSPMPRFYEHLHDVRLVKCSSKHAKHLKKANLFKHLHLGDLCIWVVAVESLHVVRALESCHLRVGKWPANSQSTKAPSQKPTRHSAASRRPSRRAPPRFRRKASVRDQALQHLNIVCNKAAKVAKVSRGCQELVIDSKYLQQALYLSFRAAYLHVLSHRVAISGQTGPLDLRAASCRALFACYVCQIKSTSCGPCWESIRQRWNLVADVPGCEAIVALQVLLQQPSCQVRARGLKACDSWLKQHGLPGSRKERIRWPLDLPRRVFHDCVAEIRRNIRAGTSPLLAWLALNVEAVAPRRKNFTCRWQHIRCCKDMCDATLFSRPVEHLQLSKEEASCMRLCKRFWKTPVYESPNEAARRAEQNLAAWLRTRPFLVAPSWKRHIHGWLCSNLRCDSTDLTRYLAYTKQLVVPEGYVAVQEDKDKAACWIMPIPVYQKLFALMVNQDKDHWSRRDGMPDNIVEQYRLQHEERLPPHLQRYASKGRWRSWQLAYMYVNVKSKCFRSGIGRVCTKPSHACCRRVVSWRAHPCRWLYKQNARALEAAVRLWGKGFETPDLFSAVRDLRKAVDCLKHEHACIQTCFRCRSPKQPLCAWVGDAAQLFEEISRTEVLRRLQSLIDVLRDSSSAPGIVTKKSRRLHYWFARNNFRASQGATLHRWSDILTITDLALSKTCVKVGPCIYEQCRGVPIGGFLSKQCASIYLGFSEQAFTQRLAEVDSSDWCPPGMSFTETVAATRYVDDLVLVSSALCPACLNLLPSHIYAKPVQFDETKATELGLPWLDVWLRCEGLHLRIHAHGVEHDWRSAARLGEIGLPCKFRLIPFQGTDRLDVGLLTALLNGKLQRLLSLHLTEDDMRRAVECEIQVWLLHGYPLQHILQIWRRGKYFPAAVKYGRELLDHGIQTCGPDACVNMPGNPHTS